MIEWLRQRRLREKQPLSEWTEYFHYHKFSLFKAALRLEKYIRVISEFVPENETILEVGFGSGAASLLLADMGYRVTAIDIDPQLVEEFGGKVQSFPDLTVKRADMFGLPFESNSFYAVVSEGVLEHFGDEEISQALLEQKRVSSHLVIFDVPNNRGRVPANVKATPLDYRLLSHKTWKTFIKKCGLSIEMEYKRGTRPHIFWLIIYFSLPLILHRLDAMKTNSIYNLLSRALGEVSGFVCKI